MFHGHAVNIDMAFSATIAARRGYITSNQRDRILGLMSRIGLALDHPLFEEDLVWQATESITLTRDGLQRAAMPRPIGSCFFANDLTKQELAAALQEHKQLCSAYPRGGDGVEMYPVHYEPELVGSET
jgi:3-dehydroquinate synthase